MGLKAENRFLLLWGGIGALAFTIIWFLPWRFQVNDDAIMMWLVSGAYTGKPESYAVFIHPLLSWTFSKLYTVIPSINWYPLTWFFIMFLSWLNLLSSIFKGQQDKFLRLFFVLFLLAFSIHFLFFLQFSILAAFAVASGLISRGIKCADLLQTNSSLKRNRPLTLYASDTLIVLGALIRIEVLFLMLAGILVLGFFHSRKVLKLQFFLAPTIILILLYAYSQGYIHHAGLQDFNRANKLRSSVFDDPVLQLQKESFRDLNPDLRYFANGLMDFNRETELLQKLETWNQLIDQKRTEVMTPKTLFKAFTFFVWNERYFCFLFAILITVSLFLQFKKSLISLAVLLAIMIVLAPFFLLKIQVYVIILLSFFSSLFLFGTSKKTKGPILIAPVIILIILIPFHLTSFLDSNKNLFPSEEFQEFMDFEDLYPNYNHIYLIGLDHVNYHFLDFKPTSVRYLGWPTLLFNSTSGANLYRVNKLVYQENLGYFSSTQIINESPDYIDLIFTK